MKIVHLMKKEKFTRGIALFYDTHFPGGEHEILYINSPGEESLINPELSIRQSEVYLGPKDREKTSALLRRLSQYDLIVMHSLFFMHYTLLLHPQLVRKMVWIAWGYDLYNWPGDCKGIKSKLTTAIGRYIRNHCCGFVGIFPPDCDYFRKKFPKAKAKVYYAPYCGATIPEEYKHYSETSNLERRQQDGEPIYIQIGHSAVRSVNHIPVLDSLQHLKDKNIRLLIPLSYGDKQYGDQVQRYAEELFGDKAICLRDFMPADQYFALTERVDVAVFNTQRQIALGNINRMVFRNVKVYIPEQCSMYGYYWDNGAPIQRYEDLASVDFATLAQPVKTQDRETFERFIESYRDMDAKVKMWKTIYNDLTKSNVGDA